MLNAAPACALPEDLLASVDVLVVNELEAEEVAGAPGEPGGLIDVLVGRVPAVVITMGARGATYGDRTGLRHEVSAPRIQAVDTTAAGDAFTGALAVAWGERHPVVHSLRWACAAGAACARRPGASAALPTRDEIDELFISTYGVPA
jgi:ribokinase